MSQNLSEWREVRAICEHQAACPPVLPAYALVGYVAGRYRCLVHRSLLKELTGNEILKVTLNGQRLYETLKICMFYQNLPHAVFLSKEIYNLKLY